MKIKKYTNGAWTDLDKPVKKYDTYTDETTTLPLTIEASTTDAIENYQVYGTSEGAGVETENLAPEIDDSTFWSPGYINQNGAIISTGSYGNNYRTSDFISVTPNTPYSFQCSLSGLYYGILSYDEQKNVQRFIVEEQGSTSISSHSFTTSENTSYIRMYVPNTSRSSTYYRPMVLINGTSVPTSYTPYGYKLPMTVESGEESTTIPIYIGNSKLMAEEYVDYEEQKVYKLKEVHKDTVTINGIEWDILGYDHDTVYKSDNTLAQHSVTIQTHDCISELQFGAREALFAFPDGLAAGSYTFTIKAHSWVSTDVNKSLTFTLTQAIPKGGQLVVSQAFNASFTTGDISSYASSSATKPIETVKMNEGDTGTSLGDVTNAIVDNTNSCQRALLGSNRWGTSALKQLLNSDKAAGTFWKAQTVFDRPPSWAANTAGFLYGMDPDFVSVIGKVNKRTALNTVSDGGGYEDSVEKVFLLSRSEVYAGEEHNIDEGGPYDYFKDFSDFSAPSTGKDTNRIKYRNGAAKYWWLRSPITGDAYHVRTIGSSGELDYYIAINSHGVAPACCIILDDINTNPYLQSLFLKPTDPPVPLPPIPTYKGENNLSVDTTVQPEKVAVEYEGWKGVGDVEKYQNEEWSDNNGT